LAGIESDHACRDGRAFKGFSDASGEEIFTRPDLRMRMIYLSVMGAEGLTVLYEFLIVLFLSIMIFINFG